MSPKSKNKNKPLFKLFLKVVIAVLLIGTVYAYFIDMFSINTLIAGREPQTSMGLRNKNNKLVVLENERNFSVIYDEYLVSEAKTKTRKQFVSDAKSTYEKDGFEYSKFEIHNVYVEGDIGYIDRTRIDCFDSECNNKKESRGYRKWKYVNGRWYTTLESAICARSIPYKKEPEFERALSLLLQRYKNSDDSDIKTYEGMLNCVEIKYADLENEGAEGVFYFDENVSSPERLVIQVNNSYKSYDDLSTAFLLSHELVHAKQFIELLFLGKQRSCTDQEAEAFLQQVNLSIYLLPEERRSLLARLDQYNTNNQLEIYANLNQLTTNAVQHCTNGYNSAGYTDEQYECFRIFLIEQLRDMVSSNPAYQEQCNL